MKKIIFIGFLYPLLCIGCLSANRSDNIKDEDCRFFISRLESCSPFSCTEENLYAQVLEIPAEIFGTNTTKIIPLGKNKCKYTLSKNKNNTTTIEYECILNNEQREKMVDFYTKLYRGKNISRHWSSTNSSTVIHVDGKLLEDPKEEFFKTGICKYYD